MRDILLFALTGFFSLTAVSRPVVGMLAFLGYSIIGPHSLTWGPSRTFPHAQCIAIGTIIGFFFSSQAKKFPNQREFTLMLVLWGIFGISTTFALYGEDAFAKFIYVSKIFFMMFLSLALINTEDRLHMMMRVIALSIGFYALKGGIFALRTGGSGQVFGPANSFLEANNSIGLALAMNVPLLFYLLKMETKVYLCWVMRAMLVLSYPAIICTFSRGAWIALTIVTAIIVMKSKYKFLTWSVVGILVISSPVWLRPLISERISDRFDLLANYEQDTSAMSRFWNWEFCTRVGMARPFGGGFEFYYPEVYVKYFPEFVEYWSNHFKGGFLAWSCHSMWFTMLGEHGILGIFVWMSILGSCFLSFRVMRSHAKTHAGMEWAAHYSNMLQLAFIAYMVSGSFLDVAYFDVFYQLVGAVILIKERLNDRLCAATETASITEMTEGGQLLPHPERLLFVRGGILTSHKDFPAGSV